MPIGSFLDAFPPALFIAAHVLFLAIGLLAVKRAADNQSPVARALWLYAASQVVFLGFFGGLMTMKMAVLIEQTFMVILIVVMTRSDRLQRRSSIEGARAKAS